MSFLNMSLSRFQMAMLAAFVTVSILLADVYSAFAQDSTPAIDIDPTPLFEAINDNLPWIFLLFSIPIGILVGIAIVRGFGNLLVGAFERFSGR